MKNFISVNDAGNIWNLVNLSRKIKEDPYAYQGIGKNKTLGLIFFNPSLRTRLSTQKAAKNLGMDVMIMNFDKEGWALETEEGAIMNGSKAEHIKEAAAVISQYCDMIGIRSFPGLVNREEDYKDSVLHKFIEYSGVPVISLESSILHPLQSLADLVTIEEWKKKEKPKVVLTWAPHVKILPQAVPNSLAQWMNAAEYEFVITHPPGYELAPEFTGKAAILYDQEKALAGADFVYAKNWSSWKEYGKAPGEYNEWQITAEKMKLTDQAKFMHCLPVRRNVVVSDEVLDSEYSVHLSQSANRLYAAQAVLYSILRDQFQKTDIMYKENEPERHYEKK